MKIFGWHVPFTSKETDLNTVTPIRAPYTLASSYGTIFESFGGAWQRNLVMDDARSLVGVSAVFACLSLISGDIAKLRLVLKKRTESGIWQETESSAYSPVLREPNRYQTDLQFIENWVLSKLIWGNTYVLKERDERNVVTALYILDPQRVTPLIAPDAEVFYHLNPDHLSGIQVQDTVPASEIIHDRNRPMFHPLCGIPPLFASALSGTQGRRIQQNAAKFFENMSRPSGILTAPGLITDETAARLKREFEANFSGGNLGRTMVAGDDIKYQGMSMPAEHAQLIEQQRWTVEDICRAFNVPLYKIGAGQVPSFPNVSALNLDYYTQTLQIYMEAIERLIDKGLGLGKGLGVEFDIDGLVRMDPKLRAETHQILVNSAIYSPDEARAKWDLPKVKGGDQPYMQQQMWQVGQLSERTPPDDMPVAPAQNDDGGAERAAAAEALRRDMDDFVKALEVA